MSFKNILVNLIGHVGYEIRRKPEFDESSVTFDPLEDQKRLFALVEKYSDSVKIIFDVGANIGQSALKYRAKFPNSNIYSFEPILSCYEKIVSLSKKDHKILPFQIALDAKEQNINFHEMKGSQTSSLLLPSEDVKSFYAEGYFRIRQTYQLLTNTIDNFCDKEKISHIDILKLDTQGTEDRVLQGAVKMLRQQEIDLIFAEVSFSPIYENNVLFFQLCDLLYKYGYHLYSIYDFTRGANGLVVASDALFVKDEIYRSILK
jgi:FkbM family methyltransferase